VEIVTRLLILDSLTAAAFLAIWYFCFFRINRRKGRAALHWVEAACSGKGSIIASQWLSASRLRAQVSFTSHWFEHAQVTVRLRPRPLPFHWLASLWRKQKETLTFEADLDFVPAFNLEVWRHRWITHPRSSERTRNWMVTRPGPVVLTTRTHWSQELTPVVNALMTSRGHNLVSVRFRPNSPHLAATVPLDALTDRGAASDFLGMLLELAAGAAHRQ